MAATTLHKEEGYGLAVAIAAHVGLVAFLLWRPPGKELVMPPERMTVTISDEVGLTSTSPEPDAQAAPDAGPELGEAPPEPAPQAEPEPLPPQPAPRPAPQPRDRPKPVTVAKPTMRPTPPRPAPAPRQAAKPATKAPSRPAPSQQPARPTNRPGSTSFSDAFKTGVPGSQPSNSQSRNPPAAAAGPAVQAALAGAISRQLKPRWVAPQGADAEQLVTILSWNLNADGTVAGTPRLVRQEGITDANRPQAARHAEQAIRAVQLAAPFDLPEQHYNSWKRIASFRFDKRLSQ